MILGCPVNPKPCQAHVFADNEKQQEFHHEWNNGTIQWQRIIVQDSICSPNCIFETCWDKV